MKGFPQASWDDVTKDINFPVKHVGLSKEYRSVFGPHFSTNSQMPHCNNDGLRGAVRRLTCVRKPEIVGWHELLRDNQYAILERIPLLISNWTTWFRNGLRFITMSKLDSFKERNLWCDKPHPKRLLRQNTRTKVVQHGTVSMNARVKCVDYKCKTKELLPPGKYPRAIGDLTAPGSTALGYYMDWVKEQFELPFHVGRCSCRFIKTPDHNILAEVFRNLIQPTGLYFCFFSDDSCISVQCTDGILTANLDISACDGSNFDPVFNILKDAMSVDSRYSNDIQDAFKQCRSGCVIKEIGGTSRIRMKPRGHVLYSGSVLTTSINNMANTLIFLHIVHLLRDRVVCKDEMRRIIVDAGLLAGYELKIDECHTHSDIQFLKHSPALIGDLILPYLNIGVLLRSFGTIPGDLPGKRKLGLVKRAKMFNSDVIKSWKHAGNTSVRRAFNNKIIDETLNYTPPDTTWKSGNSSQTPIPDQEICSRYNISLHELDELNETIANSSIGDRVSLRVVDKIMNKDYSYPL